MTNRKASTRGTLKKRSTAEIEAGLSTQGSNLTVSTTTRKKSSGTSNAAGVKPLVVDGSQTTKSKKVQLCAAKIKDNATNIEYRVPEVDIEEDVLALVDELTTTHKYSPTDKLKACAYFNVIGNMSKVSKMLGIEYRAMQYWKTQAWWPVVSKAVRTAKQEELDIKLSAIVDESTDQLMDRIKNGDHRLTKMGQVKRVPMTGKDIAQAGLGVVLEKREFLRGGGKSLSKSERDTQKVLENLKNTFEQLAKSVTPQEKPVIEHGEDIAEAEIIEETT